MEKRCRDTMHYLSKPSEGPVIVTMVHRIHSFSMHPRRRNGYRTSYRNPVAVHPARVYTLKSPTTCNNRAGTCS